VNEETAGEERQRGNRKREGEGEGGYGKMKDGEE